MLTIHHFLSWFSFSVGAFIGFVFLAGKMNKRRLMMFLLLTGLAIGMHEHVFNQDQWAYGKDTYQTMVVEGGYHPPNPIKQSICLAIYNDYNVCPNKRDPRWDDEGYWGEIPEKEYLGTGVVNP